MLIEVCTAKIHHATVSDANLNYKGSITIDQDILDKCEMRPYQYVNITNLANGVFWRTYIMPGQRGNKDICLNGPPAHHFKRGDKIIILAQAWIDPNEYASIDPVVVFMHEDNTIEKVRRMSDPEES